MKVCEGEAAVEDVKMESEALIRAQKNRPFLKAGPCVLSLVRAASGLEKANRFSRHFRMLII